MEEAESPGSGASPPKCNADTGAAIYSDELDHVPLVRRRIMLLAEKQSSNPPIVGIVCKEEEEEDTACNSPDVFSLTPAFSSREAVVGVSGREQTHQPENDAEVDSCLQNGTCSQDVGSSTDCLSEYSLNMTCNESNDDAAEATKLDANMCTSSQCSPPSEFPPKVRVEYSDNLLYSPGAGIDSPSAGVQTVMVKDEICDDVENDHLDHIVLIERRRMLLSRKLLGLKIPEDGIHTIYAEVPQTSEAFNLPDDNERIHLLARKSIDSNSHEGKDVPVFTNDMDAPSISTSVKIKAEPQDENGHNSEMNARDTFPFNISMLKTESEFSDELDENDKADHMSLGDRMKLLRARGADIKLNASLNCEFSKKSVHPFSEDSHIASEPAKTFNVNRPRKRKKTATDSVETALEEDAPGLLQILIEKGVLLEEMRLYGETESDEAIDYSSSEDTFSELESVISKIFTRRPSHFNFAPIRCTKGAKASYCLAALMSLVEQSRYLQFRNWPVEWGWCRDLQSFIFVFERHKRIVLERPEYGYATYFFELDSLPIDWQIKRLVTAMKVTTFSRVSLIENKALSVGDDLTEGEAKVLMGYGWVPNTGLATMLKYCDRVVHDRKNDKDISEWRSKIGKLLVHGYNGGTVVETNIPENVMEYTDSQEVRIKLEPEL